MRRPFVILLFFLLIGILIGFYTGLQVTAAMLLIVLLLALLLLLTFRGSHLPFICMMTVFFGSFIFYIHSSADARLSEALQPMTLQAELLDYLKPKKYYYEADIKLISYATEDGYKGTGEKALLQLRGAEATNAMDLAPGSLLQLESAQLIKDLTDSYDSYDLYLRSKGYRYVIRTSGYNVSAIGARQKWPLLISSLKARIHIEDFFDAELMPKTASLIKSIIFGNQGYMQEELLESFSRSGTAHIVAVSGLHIGIIVLLIQKLFDLIGLGKNKALVLTLMLIYGYAYVVGFPVSIIRAGLMYLIYALAYFFDRRYDAVNSLMLVAVIAVSINPFVIFSVAFQMSFGATLSILMLYPKLLKLLEKLPRAIGSLIAITLAAQIGTMPITAYYFNQFSVISPLTNLLIVPCLGVVLTLGLAGGLLSLISVKAAAILMLPLSWVLKYIIAVVEVSSSLEYSSIGITGVGPLHMLLYYILLTVVYAALSYREVIIKNIRRLGNYELSTNNRGHQRE